MTFVNLTTQQKPCLNSVAKLNKQALQQSSIKVSYNANKQIKRQKLALLAGTQQEQDQELLSDTELKKKKADNLRQQERDQIVIGDGTAKCGGCGYVYQPGRGDQDNLVPKGTKFNDVPSDYSCPICGAPKIKFQSDLQKVPGFAANQGYGFGVNRMTSNNKSLLIFGSLLAFVALFIAGYNMG